MVHWEVYWELEGRLSIVASIGLGGLLLEQELLVEVGTCVMSQNVLDLSLGVVNLLLESAAVVVDHNPSLMAHICLSEFLILFNSFLN